MKDSWQVAKRRPGDGGGSGWNRKPRPSAVRRLTQAWALLAIVGVLTALAGACGGGTGNDAALAPCRALQALKAYRYFVDLKLESPEPAETPAEPRPTPTSTLTRQFTGPFRFESNIEASFVAPDRFQVLTITGPSRVSTIIIGGQAWVEMDGSWRPTVDPYGPAYTPSQVCEAILADLDLLLVQAQEEKINDVETLHYTFPQVSSEQAMGKIFGPQSDMDILIKKLDVDLWLATEGNWPARIDIQGSGLYADGRELRVHLLVDTRDANSGDIRVEPPF